MKKTKNVKKQNWDWELENEMKTIWMHNPNGSITTKLAYSQLISSEGPVQIGWWDLNLWKRHAPLKIKCFFGSC